MSETKDGFAAAKSIYEAILAVTKEVGTLGKAAFNPHGQYAYVSIDAYYQAVGQSAAKHGLTWVLVQDAFTLHPSVGRSGVVEITYRVHLLHESGATILDFTKTSIIHPLQGAQTVGSAMSYADKVFQRQLFKIATGEDDADATNATDVGTARNANIKPQQLPAVSQEEFLEAPDVEVVTSNEEASATIEDTIAAFIPDCNNIDVLHNFYRDNVGAIDRLKTLNPAKHKKLMDSFIKRKQELTGPLNQAPTQKEVEHVAE